MKVLIIGSGAREHALASAFARSPRVLEVIVSPGNAGIAREFKCVCLDGFEAVTAYVHNAGIGLVFIGPEIPIADGMSDFLREQGIPAIAPSQAAARLETSKAFAKALMQEKGIPSATYKIIQKTDNVDESLMDCSYPLVLKADGLAAGKGVIIVNDYNEAVNACQSLFRQECGASGIVAEEFLQGWEVSLFVITDGEDYQCTLFSQDHKQLYDLDMGPNTGGMGAICPVPEAETYREEIETSIIKPVLIAMRDLGCPYQGILYLGLMITKTGVKVIEFNCRFGDPETQAVLPLLTTDLVDVCEAILKHTVRDLVLTWEEQICLAVVMASSGYPGNYKKGYPIAIPEFESQVLFAGVKGNDQELFTSGGRVLTVVGKGNDLASVREAVYRDVLRIEYEGRIFRTDIGLRANRLV